MKVAAEKHFPTFAWPRLSRNGLVARLLRLDAARRQRHDLSQLDDHLLKDIGVTREDVRRELARPLAW